MSPTDLLITPDAQDDWRQILDFTWRTWGEEQCETYDAVIWSALRHIQEFPEIGHPSFTQRDEREYVLPHHTIVYQYNVRDAAVTILRILSNRRRRRR